MQLVPVIGTEPVRSDAFSIVVDKGDLKRISALVLAAALIDSVSEDTLDQATEMAGRIKTMIAEIQDAKRSAKRPFEAVEQAIENRAKAVSADLDKEGKRIHALIRTHVGKIESEQQAIAKRNAEIEAKAQAEIAEYRRKAQAERNEKEKARLLEEAMDKELLLEVEQIGNEKPEPPHVPGGRVSHPWKFKVTDLKALVASGGGRLIRWEIDKLACQDLMRELTERQPPDYIPEIPGLQITREVSVSIRASA